MENSSLEVSQFVFEDFRRTANTWFSMYMRCIYGHYFMSGFAVVLSVVIASNILKEHETVKSILAILLGIDTGLIALLGLEKRANQAQRAWRILRVALAKYQADTSHSLDPLVIAYERGEDILHETQTKVS